MIFCKLIKQNLWLFAALLLFSCDSQQTNTEVAQSKKDSTSSCMMVPARFGAASVDSSLKFTGDTSFKEMVFIKGGSLMMGGNNSQASADEYPKHKVQVRSFWMDAN